MIKILELSQIEITKNHKFKIKQSFNFLLLQLKEHINELRFDQDKEKYLVKENSKLKENNKILEKKLENFKVIFKFYLLKFFYQKYMFN